MVAQTRKSGNSPKKLKFSDKLVGKGLSTDALLKKLKTLHTELAELDQENVELKTLNSSCKELISTSILLHKDKGVKAYAACCLADLLRLYAPDAPYTAPELRDIFQFFFRQLSTGLKGSDSPYYNEYFHLLESLSTVKSVVLICDLPHADELMVQIFREFFGLVRHDLAKNIEMFMSDILIALIDECQTLPSDVLEAIMAQFMDKNARMEQPAYRLAVEVCNATSDKLQRHVCQYFTDIIVQQAQAEDFDEVRTAHELIKRLNHSCPSLLHNVVPQLEEELRVEEVQLRQMATQVLGEMFADKGGGDLEKKYASTWSLWLARKNDKSAVVRLAFVEACKGLLVHHRSELREAVEESMDLKLYDPDEKIRAAVCKLYSQLDYETSLHHVSEKMLRAVGGRSMDKKQSVRHEALMSIGKLYSVAYPEIENNDPAAVKHFAWIPQQVLHAITATLEIKSVAEHVIAEHILPLPAKGDDEVAWTDRLLTTMKHLDEKAITTLMGFSGIKNSRPTIFERYVQCCMENNGGVIDEDEENVKRKLAAVIKHIAGQFHDPQKAADDLQTFAKMNEQRLYKLLKTCMDPQTDLKGLVKASNEFVRREEQSSAASLATMTSFLRKSSLWIVNQSSIPTLVKRVQKGDPMGTGHGTSQAQLSANNAQALLTAISKYCPAILKPHVSEFAKAIADEKNPRLVEVCLQALGAVSRWEPSITPSDKRTIDRVKRYVHEPNPRHAKFSARVLAHTKKSDELCAEVIDAIAQSLPENDPELLVAHVAVLAEMARSAPDAFEQKSDVIMAFLVKETLMTPCPRDEDGMEIDDGVEWVDDDKLPPLAKAKILSLKVCRRRCLAHAQLDSALDIANPVLKMFFTLLDNGGSIKEDALDDPRVKSRVRLQAAWSLVQLATVDKFSDVIATNFIILALTVQDSCFQVRLGFLSKLIGLLHARRLHPRFNLVPFLTAHDPEPEVKEKAHAYVAFVFRRALPDIKVSHFEMIFIRLLHLLAHHPDFGVTDQQLKEMAKYINLYLDLIATAENLPLLYHLAMKAKTVRDAQSDTFSENLYVTSELAQELIKRRSRQHGWSLTSYPGKIKLPSDIFRALPNPDTANKILKNQYLPEGTMKLFQDDALNPVSKDKSRVERKVAPKRKALRKSNGASVKRARPSVKRRKYDEDDENDDAEGSGEDDEKSDVSSTGSGAHHTRAGSSSEDAGDSQDEKKNDEAQEEQLGRGARTRAKAKAKKQAKKKMKTSGLAYDD